MEMTELPDGLNELQDYLDRLFDRILFGNMALRRELRPDYKRAAVKYNGIVGRKVFNTEVFAHLA